MPTPEDNLVQQNVLDAIASGKVKMRSRWYFALQTILAIVGGVVLGLFLIYMVGFILFLLVQSGLLFAPAIGFAGWYIFFRSLPWLLIISSLIFLLVLVILVNHYSFSYQRPLLYSLLGIFLLVTAGSLFIAFAPVNTSFLDYANPSFLGGYYRDYGIGEIPDVHRGEVLVLGANGFVLQGMSGGTSSVLFGIGISSDTENSIKPGDLVIIFGERDASGSIEASAIDRL